MPGLKAFLFLNFLFWWLEGGICVQIEIIIIDCITFAFAHAFEVMRVIFTAQLIHNTILTRHVRFQNEGDSNTKALRPSQKKQQRA